MLLLRKNARRTLLNIRARRGLGEGPAFVFAWSRMTVIQTGAIAAVAFAYGKYAEVIRPIPIGEAGAAIHGAIASGNPTATLATPA